MKSYRYLARFIALLVVLILALFISYVLVTGQEIVPGSDPEAPQVDTNVYLPVVITPPTIYGHVTNNGSAASGVILELWLYNEGDWSLVMTTTTDANGDYVFRGMPALSGGQKYLVEYFNDVDPSRLGLWDTRELTSFPDGSTVNIGDFDIANVELVAPEPGLLVGTGSTFQWMTRPATPSDRYAFGILDIFDYDPSYFTSPIDDASSYVYNTLPSNFKYCIPYFWGVVVYGPDGGRGTSFEVRVVTLYNATPTGIHGCVAEGGVPRQGVSLELFRWDDSEGDYISHGTTTTNSNGYFAFNGQPALVLNDEYYVDYTNSTGPARLPWYGTYDLTNYTAGSTVHIGDFDIANISLVSPAPGSTVPPTTTFSWTPRPATLWDNYEFNLYDPDDGDPWFSTIPSLGYVDHYDLTGLPSGFAPGNTYWWDIVVYDLFGGYGYSDAKGVKFSSTGLSTEPADSPENLERRDLKRLRMDRMRHTQSDRLQAGLEARSRRYLIITRLNGQK